MQKLYLWRIYDVYIGVKRRRFDLSCSCGEAAQCLNSEKQCPKVF